MPSSFSLAGKQVHQAAYLDSRASKVGHTLARLALRAALQLSCIVGHTKKSQTAAKRRRTAESLPSYRLLAAMLLAAV